MKKSYFCLFALLASLLFATSCSKDSVSRAEYDAMVAERDSLANQNGTTNGELQELNSYLATLSECIDSISAAQALVVQDKDPETGRRYRRDEVRQRLKDLGELIQRQRATIQALCDSLNSREAGSAKIAELTSLVTFLNIQLQEKEAEVDRLQQEVASGRRNIEQLTASVAELNETNTTLTEENTNLDNQVAQQTEQMNEGYFMAKTKKELEEMGLLKGGFLKKSSFRSDNIDLSQCARVDMRTFNDVTLTTSKPKLLTQAPDGSYEFRKIDDKKYQLIILDTVAFWSLSKVVIVQL